MWNRAYFRHQLPADLAGFAGQSVYVMKLSPDRYCMFDGGTHVRELPVEVAKEVLVCHRRADGSLSRPTGVELLELGQRYTEAKKLKPTTKAAIPTRRRRRSTSSRSLATN